MKTILTLSISTLLLASCTQSSWLAGGYTGQDVTPLSSPKKVESWNKDFENNDLLKHQNTQAVLSALAADIMVTLEDHISKETPIFLTPTESSNGTMALLDHSLRDKLTKARYTLSSTPEKSHVLSYDISPNRSEEEDPQTYDIKVFGMGEKGWELIEKRTQQLPEDHTLSVLEYYLTTTHNNEHKPLND